MNQLPVFQVNNDKSETKKSPPNPALTPETFNLPKHNFSKYILPKFYYNHCLVIMTNILFF